MLLPDVPNYWLHYYLLALVGATHPMPGSQRNASCQTDRETLGMGVIPVSPCVRPHVGAVSCQAVLFCSAGYVCRRDRERPSALCVPF